MLARSTCAIALALAIAGLFAVPAWSTQALPSLSLPDAAEPAIPLQSFTSESGFFARWRADHEQRAARDGWIETDRPSFTLSSAVVPRGWLQLESGYLYEHAEYGYWQNNLTFDAHTLPQLNLRYGVTDRLEFRFQWAGVQFQNLRWSEYPWWWGFPRTVHATQTLYSNTSVGIKYQVSQNDGWIPQSVFVTELGLPTGDGYNRVTPLIDYVYSWFLTERIALGGSTGAFFYGFSDLSVMQYFQSAILRFHYSPRLSLFCEWFGVFQRPVSYAGNLYGDFEFMPYFNTGVQFRPLANIQLDWQIGVPLPEQVQPDGIFTGCGLSFRY